MKGLNVKHDIDELRAGTEVILTLADSNIINKDDLNRTLNVNESEVMLENVTMSELENRMAVEKRKKRACPYKNCRTNGSNYQETLKLIFHIKSYETSLLFPS